MQSLNEFESKVVPVVVKYFNDVVMTKMCTSGENCCVSDVGICTVYNYKNCLSAKVVEWVERKKMREWSTCDNINNMDWGKIKESMKIRIYASRC